MFMPVRVALLALRQTLETKVILNIVGVDIGCGMLTVELGTANIDYAELDRIIRENIPSGRSVRDTVLVDFPEFHDLRCWNRLREKRLART